MDIAKDILPENVLTLKHKNTNVNIDNEIISLTDLEKIFFLSKLSNDSAFISSVLNIPVRKINTIINSCQFQEAINEQLAEYTKHQIAEPKEQLLLRYQDFLKELFITLRVSVGIRIRESMESGEPLSEKQLYITPIEKLMKLEFALHGLPIDIKGILHGKSDTKTKTDKDLIKSLEGIKSAIESDGRGTFDPSKMIDGKIEDAKIVKPKVEIKEKNNTRKENVFD